MRIDPEIVVRGQRPHTPPKAVFTHGGGACGPQATRIASACSDAVHSEGDALSAYKDGVSAVRCTRSPDVSS